MRDIRRAALIIGCGDSDLRARIASYWSGGAGVASVKGGDYYLFRIRFANWVRQESELFNLFLSNKVSNRKK